MGNKKRNLSRNTVRREGGGAILIKLSPGNLFQVSSHPMQCPPIPSAERAASERERERGISPPPSPQVCPTAHDLSLPTYGKELEEEEEKPLRRIYVDIY